MPEKTMPGFMTYREAALIYRVLSDEEAGRLIKAVSRYYLSGSLPAPEGVAAEVYEVLCAGVDRGRESWESKRLSSLRAAETRRRKNASASCENDAAGRENDTAGRENDTAGRENVPSRDDDVTTREDDDAPSGDGDDTAGRENVTTRDDDVPTRDDVVTSRDDVVTTRDDVVTTRDGNNLNLNQNLNQNDISLPADAGAVPPCPVGTRDVKKKRTPGRTDPRRKTAPVFSY